MQVNGVWRKSVWESSIWENPTTTNGKSNCKKRISIQRMGPNCPYGHGSSGVKTARHSVSAAIGSNAANLLHSLIERFRGYSPLQRGPEMIPAEKSTVSTFSEGPKTSVFGAKQLGGLPEMPTAVPVAAARAGVGGQHRGSGARVGGYGGGERPRFPYRSRGEERRKRCTASDTTCRHCTRAHSGRRVRE